MKRMSKMRVVIVGAALLALAGVTVHALLTIEDDMDVQGEITKQGVAIATQADISDALSDVRLAGGPFGDLSMGSFTSQ